jgi:hypothetical protein
MTAADEEACTTVTTSSLQFVANGCIEVAKDLSGAYDGPLAQRVEQLTLNQEVRGSSP